LLLLSFILNDRFFSFSDFCLKMSKKSAVKKTVPAMFIKNPPVTTTDQEGGTKENKPKPDRLVPWVEK
jgi:hypothetical protein